MPLWPLKHASPDDGAFDRLRASIDPDWIDQALELTGALRPATYMEWFQWLADRLDEHHPARTSVAVGAHEAYRQWRP
jgi:hypothetical protein